MQSVAPQSCSEAGWGWLGEGAGLGQALGGHSLPSAPVLFGGRFP